MGLLTTAAALSEVVARVRLVKKRKQILENVAQDVVAVQELVDQAEQRQGRAILVEYSSLRKWYVAVWELRNLLLVEGSKETSKRLKLALHCGKVKELLKRIEKEKRNFETALQVKNQK